MRQAHGKTANSGDETVPLPCCTAIGLVGHAWMLNKCCANLHFCRSRVVKISICSEKIVRGFVLCIHEGVGNVLPGAYSCQRSLDFTATLHGTVHHNTAQHGVQEEMKTVVAEGRFRNTSPKFYKQYGLCTTLVAFVLGMNLDGLSG